MKYFFAVVAILLVVGIGLPIFRVAALNPCDPRSPTTGQQLCNPIQNEPGKEPITSLKLLVIRILFLVGGFALSMPIVAMTFSGFAMVISQGNQEDITKAKESFKWTVYGFMVAVLSFVLMSAMIQLLGAGGLQGINPDAPGADIKNPLMTDNFGLFVNGMIQRFLEVVGIIAILMLVFNGLRYITADGEEEQITQAKAALKWISAGIVVILFAYVIIKAAANLVGLE